MFKLYKVPFLYGQGLWGRKAIFKKAAMAAILDAMTLQCNEI